MLKVTQTSRPHKNLLNTSLCSLDIHTESKMVKECIQTIKKELKAKGIDFDFHYWVSDDWFCPDGVTGMAIPFYLFNLSALKLITKAGLETEGVSKEECLKLIRHELGHVLDNAFDIRSREDRIKLFGDSNQSYPTEYIRKPFSKNYVKYLKENYAQAHPDEDWAETFAVWLDPEIDWTKKYQNWPALKKLRYVDQVMHEIAGKNSILKNIDTIDEISTIGITLKTYINRKSKLKPIRQHSIFGMEIYKVFQYGNKADALNYLINNEKELCTRVAKNTNQYNYIVKDVLKELKRECRENKLTLKLPPKMTRSSIINLLNRSTEQYIQLGKNKVIM